MCFVWSEHYYYYYYHHHHHTVRIALSTGLVGRRLRILSYTFSLLLIFNQQSLRINLASFRRMHCFWQRLFEFLRSNLLNRVWDDTVSRGVALAATAHAGRTFTLTSIGLGRVDTFGQCFLETLRSSALDWIRHGAGPRGVRPPTITVRTTSCLFADLGFDVCGQGVVVPRMFRDWFRSVFYQSIPEGWLAMFLLTCGLYSFQGRIRAWEGTK